ncbi:hypothetical protein CCACVL1_21299 [Corchorus capsularis]|uniref:Uncharacterized protein n=1 Tax=Corchorus capsularis TaxID=210143 RepID=A0A1R3H757_COCAP|nr:hypothetical protein CCACVL1_21299 [Corchorus capsularis]
MYGIYMPRIAGSPDPEAHETERAVIWGLR